MSNPLQFGPFQSPEGVLEPEAVLPEAAATSAPAPAAAAAAVVTWSDPAKFSLNVIDIKTLRSYYDELPQEVIGGSSGSRVLFSRNTTPSIGGAGYRKLAKASDKHATINDSLLSAWFECFANALYDGCGCPAQSLELLTGLSVRSLPFEPVHVLVTLNENACQVACSDLVASLTSQSDTFTLNCKIGDTTFINIPTEGLGSVLACATWLDDVDVLGARDGNFNILVEVKWNHENTYPVKLIVIKIDPGCAFNSYSHVKRAEDRAALYRNERRKRFHGLTSLNALKISLAANISGDLQYFTPTADYEVAFKDLHSTLRQEFIDMVLSFPERDLARDYVKEVALNCLSSSKLSPFRAEINPDELAEYLADRLVTLKAIVAEESHEAWTCADVVRAVDVANTSRIGCVDVIDGQLRQYIPLQLCQEEFEFVATDENDGPGFASSVSDANQLLNCLSETPSRVLIFGDAGAGKSQALFDMATRWRWRDEVPDPNAVAFLINLNAFPSLAEASSSPVDLVDVVVKACVLKTPTAALRRLVAELLTFKSVLWLVDNYAPDFICPPALDSAFSSILSQPRCIVSCRPKLTSKWPFKFSVCFRICMTPSLISTYVSKFSAAFSTTTSTKCTADGSSSPQSPEAEVLSRHSKELYERIMKTLTSHPGIYQLAHNPLSLMLLCHKVAANETKSEPIGVVKLTVTMLFADAQLLMAASFKKNSVGNKRHFPFALLMDALKELAFISLKDGKRRFDAMLLDELRLKHGWALDNNSHAARSLWVEDLKLTGFIVECQDVIAGKRLYQFQHETFLEFFAAQHVEHGLCSPAWLRAECPWLDKFATLSHLHGMWPFVSGLLSTHPSDAIIRVSPSGQKRDWLTAFLQDRCVDAIELIIVCARSVEESHGLEHDATAVGWFKPHLLSLLDSLKLEVPGAWSPLMQLQSCPTLMANWILPHISMYLTPVPQPQPQFAFAKEVAPIVSAAAGKGHATGRRSKKQDSDARVVTKDGMLRVMTLSNLFPINHDVEASFALLTKLQQELVHFRESMTQKEIATATVRWCALMLQHGLLLDDVVACIASPNLDNLSRALERLRSPSSSMLTSKQVACSSKRDSAGLFLRAYSLADLLELGSRLADRIATRDKRPDVSLLLLSILFEVSSRHPVEELALASLISSWLPQGVSSDEIIAAVARLFQCPVILQQKDACDLIEMWLRDHQRSSNFWKCVRQIGQNLGHPHLASLLSFVLQRCLQHEDVIQSEAILTLGTLLHHFVDAEGNLAPCLSDLTPDFLTQVQHQFERSLLLGQQRVSLLSATFKVIRNELLLKTCKSCQWALDLLEHVLVHGSKDEQIEAVSAITSLGGRAWKFPRMRQLLRFAATYAHVDVKAVVIKALGKTGPYVTNLLLTGNTSYWVCAVLQRAVTTNGSSEALCNAAKFAFRSIGFRMLQCEWMLRATCTDRQLLRTLVPTIDQDITLPVCIVTVAEAAEKRDHVVDEVIIEVLWEKATYIRSAVDTTSSIIRFRNIRGAVLTVPVSTTVKVKCDARHDHELEELTKAYPDVTETCLLGHWLTHTLGVAEGPKGGIAVHKACVVVSFTMENKLRVYQLPAISTGAVSAAAAQEAACAASASAALPVPFAASAAIVQLPPNVTHVELKLLLEYGSHGDSVTQFDGVGRLCTGSVLGHSVVLACDAGNQRVQALSGLLDSTASSSVGMPVVLQHSYDVKAYGAPTCICQQDDFVAIGLNSESPSSYCVVLFDNARECAALKSIPIPASICGLHFKQLVLAASSLTFSLVVACSSEILSKNYLRFEMALPCDTAASALLSTGAVDKRADVTTKVNYTSNSDLVPNLCLSQMQDVLCLPGDKELLADTLYNRVIVFQRRTSGNLRDQVVPDVVHTSKRPIAMAVCHERALPFERPGEASSSHAAARTLVYVVDAFAPTVHVLQVPAEPEARAAPAARKANIKMLTTKAVLAKKK